MGKRRDCAKAVSSVPGSRCCKWTWSYDGNGNRFARWIICPDAVTCDDARVDAVVVPIIFDYQPRYPEGTKKDNDIWREAMAQGFSDQTSGRVYGICVRMGIDSIPYLRSMPEEWFEFLPKVRMLGKNVRKCLLRIAGREER